MSTVSTKNEKKHSYTTIIDLTQSFYVWDHSKLSIRTAITARDWPLLLQYPTLPAKEWDNTPRAPVKITWKYDHSWTRVLEGNCELIQNKNCHVPAPNSKKNKKKSMVCRPTARSPYLTCKFSLLKSRLLYVNWLSLDPFARDSNHRNQW